MMDANRLLYGPRKQGNGPKEPTAEGLEEFEMFLNAACEEQWLSMAEQEIEEEIMPEQGISKDEFDELVESFLYNHEWAESCALVHYYKRNNKFYIYLTCSSGSCAPGDHVIELTDAKRVITPKGGSSKWKMSGSIDTTENRTMIFDDASFEDIRKLNSQSPLLRILVDEFKLDEAPVIQNFYR